MCFRRILRQATQSSLGVILRSVSCKPSRENSMSNLEAALAHIPSRPFDSRATLRIHASSGCARRTICQSRSPESNHLTWGSSEVIDRIFLAQQKLFECPHRARDIPSKFAGYSADCKRGRRKGVTSKNVKKCQKVFRHFSTIFAQGKKRQKSSKSVKKFFDTFRQFSRGTIFLAPFGGLWDIPEEKFVFLGFRRLEQTCLTPTPSCEGTSQSPDRNESQVWMSKSCSEKYPRIRRGCPKMAFSLEDHFAWNQCACASCVLRLCACVRVCMCVCVTVCECVCVYIYVVELKLVQDLGVYKLKIGPSYKFKSGPSFFLLHCYSPFL